MPEVYSKVTTLAAFTRIPGNVRADPYTPEGEPAIEQLLSGGRARAAWAGKTPPIPLDFADALAKLQETASDGGLLGFACDPGVDYSGAFRLWRWKWYNELARMRHASWLF